MVIAFLYFTLTTLPVLSLNIDCPNSACTACSTLNSYNSISCLNNCPTGYTSSSGKCHGSGSSLISTQFYQYLDFTSNTVGVFSSPNNDPFNSPSRSSPIPTKERGFYFDTNSELSYTSASDILSPDFTIRLLFRVTGCSYTSCSIIKIFKNSNLIFILSITSDSFTSTWSLQQSSDSLFSDHSLTTDFEYSTWHKLIISSKQSQGYVELIHTYADPYYHAPVYSKVLNYEFRHGDVAGLVYYLGGNGESFEGFLYDLNLDNQYIDSYLITAYLIDCNYNEYYKHPQCLNCDPSCDTWPWCVRSGACTNSYLKHCYAETCTDCTGFAQSDCSSYGVPCWRFCSTCNLVTPYKCESCPSHLTLINNACIYYPYNYDNVNTDEPAISLTFENFEQYYDGVFQSGYDGTTYAPFNYPEEDDPIPMMNRGLYFNNRSKLESVSKISLYYENSFFIWAKPMGEGFNFWNSPSILLFGSGSSSLLLSDTDSWTRFNSIKESEITEWTFYSFIHSFSGSVFQSDIYLNNVLFSTYSVEGYILYDIKTFIYILGEGFLYSLNAYNSDQSGNIASYYSDEICGPGEVKSCLWDCGPNEYFNGTCQSCLDDCEYGCITDDTCKTCFESDCLTCSNFLTSVCNSYSDSNCAPGWDALGEYNECCSSACWTCNGPYDYSCTSCHIGKVLVGTICMDECPAGYEDVNGKCYLKEELIVDFTFITIYDVYEKNNKPIQFITGQDSSYYPDHILSDPIPASHRGLYFRNTAYMKSSNFTLSSSFVVVLWVKFYEYGQVFNKNFLNFYTSGSTSIQLSAANSYVGALPPLATWTSVVVKVWTADDLRINSQFSSLIEDYESFIGTFETVIDSNSEFTLGDSENSFVGFLYRIQIYNSLSDISDLDEYKVCSVSTKHYCLWDCNINLFWNGENCENCNSRCDSGCKDLDHCNICYDQICHNCHDFTSSCDICKDHARFLFDECICNAGYYWQLSTESCVPCNEACQLCDGPSADDCLTCADSQCNICTSQFSESCIECSANYEAVNGLCVQCTESQFYDADNKDCVDCTKPCWKCQNAQSCTECLPNASFNSDGICECDPGFVLEETCQQLYFTANFSISNENIIKISFAEDLLDSLQKSDLDVKVTTSNVKISIEKISKSVWKVHLDLSKPAKKDSRVHLDIISQLYSSSKSLYVNKHYSALLFVQEDPTSEPISDITKTAEGSVITVASVILGTSIIMLDPKSFFFFLQALELYVYVLIYAVEISPGLQAFLQILNPGSLVPNVFELIIPSGNGVALTGKLSDFGYQDNLFILNSGISLFTICCLCCALPFVYLLTLVPVKWIKDWSTKRLKSYKYRVICRCYVQMFLEIILNTFIGITYTKFQNPLQVIDFGLCVLFAVFMLIGIIGFFLILANRLQDLHDAELTQRWGTVFDELKEVKSAQWFYALYFIRRLGIACIIVFIPSDLMQLVVSAILAFAIVFYVLTVKCFEHGRTNFYIVSSEILLISFYLDLIVGILSVNSIGTVTVGTAGIRILIAALMFNGAYALYELVQYLYDKYKKKKLQSVYPASHTIANIGNVTMIMDPDDLFRNPSKRLD